MYVSSGSQLSISLSESVVASNAHMMAQAVTSGNVVTRFNGLTSGTLTQTIMSGESSFVDEVTVYNADADLHNVNANIGSNTILSVHIRSGGELHYKPQLGWHRPVGSPELEPGSVVSGMIASGQINTKVFGDYNNLGDGSVLSAHIAAGSIRGTGAIKLSVNSITSANLASGQIGPFANNTFQSSHIASGQIGDGMFASGSVKSANMASGQITMPHLISGIFIGLHPPARVTEEAIPQGYCVTVSQSGYLRVAMAGVSGRMPAIGINVTSGITSGTTLSPLSGNAPMTIGPLRLLSGQIPGSREGMFLYVGRSGNIASGAISGTLCQRVGIGTTSGEMFVKISPYVNSGMDATFKGTF